MLQILSDVATSARPFLSNVAVWVRNGKRSETVAGFTRSIFSRDQQLLSHHERFGSEERSERIKAEIAAIERKQLGESSLCQDTCG